MSEEIKIAKVSGIPVFPLGMDILQADEVASNVLGGLF